MCCGAVQMPVGIPPGMDPVLAEQVLAYLQKDPVAAKEALEAAQKLMVVRLHGSPPPLSPQSVVPPADRKPMMLTRKPYRPPPQNVPNGQDPREATKGGMGNRRKVGIVLQMK
jgi:hypothetical protein